MIKSNRNILLLLDNAGCHPKETVSKFSNIQIVFLPPNTTSTLQPLDLGIIQAFKVRKHFLRYVVSKIDECETASDVVKSVNILVALKWVALAWHEVKPETITKCFRKAGILDNVLGVVGLDGADGSQDPFAEIDKDLEMQHLIEQLSKLSLGARVALLRSLLAVMVISLFALRWMMTIVRQLS